MGKSYSPFGDGRVCGKIKESGVEDFLKKTQGIGSFSTKFRDFALYPDSQLPKGFKGIRKIQRFHLSS